MSGHGQTAGRDAEPAGSGERGDAAGTDSALPPLDGVEQCGHDSFPASDPPSSWWGGTGDPNPAGFAGRGRDDRPRAAAEDSDTLSEPGSAAIESQDTGARAGSSAPGVSHPGVRS